MISTIKKVATSIIFLLVLLSCDQEKENKLWYNQPAKNWNEALPIGNGRLGGMVFGRVSKEKIQINEETIWKKAGINLPKPGGKDAIPEIRELLFNGEYKKAEAMCKKRVLADRLPSNTVCYQTLGEIGIEYDNIKESQNYYRELDLSTATVKTSFESEGSSYTRTVFSSAVDQALVMMAESDKENNISCTVSLSRISDGEKVVIEGNTLIMTEHVADGNGVKYEARLQVIAHGGKIEAKEGSIKVIGANKMELRMVAASDYRGGTPTKLCTEYEGNFKGKTYDIILKDHVKEYQGYYNRVTLSLPTSAQSKLATDVRLTNQKKNVTDPSLAALYFQFGRYLLISSSRPGCLPANLQGIWCKDLKPAWNCDYHININTQNL